MTTSPATTPAQPKRCDRCQETGQSVRWVARIGGNLCAVCRRHERTT